MKKLIFSMLALMLIISGCTQSNKQGEEIQPSGFLPKSELLDLGFEPLSKNVIDSYFTSYFNNTILKREEMRGIEFFGIGKTIVGFEGDSVKVLFNVNNATTDKKMNYVVYFYYVNDADEYIGYFDLNNKEYIYKNSERYQGENFDNIIIIDIDSYLEIYFPSILGDDE